MSELLPCPFCGGEGLEVVTGKAGQNRYKIVCSGCGIKTFETVASPLHREAWNRRHERTCHDTHKCGWFQCSECGFPLADMWLHHTGEYGYYDEENQPNYCPNCGARVVRHE